MKLVAGLGNPGKEYEHTRHNMGFDVIDELARRWAVNVWKTDMKAEIASVVRFGEKILLVKPLTYMNLSGDAVGAIANYYKIPAEDIYIICDDLDLPAGKTRIRKKGSAGGHNGIKSLIAGLHTEEFVRFRIGWDIRRTGIPLLSMFLAGLMVKKLNVSKPQRSILLIPWNGR